MVVTTGLAAAEKRDYVLGGLADDKSYCCHSEAACARCRHASGADRCVAHTSSKYLIISLVLIILLAWNVFLFTWTNKLKADVEELQLVISACRQQHESQASLSPADDSDVTVRAAEPWWSQIDSDEGDTSGQQQQENDLPILNHRVRRDDAERQARRNLRRSQRRRAQEEREMTTRLRRDAVSVTAHPHRHQATSVFSHFMASDALTHTSQPGDGVGGLYENWQVSPASAGVSQVGFDGSKANISVAGVYLIYAQISNIIVLRSDPAVMFNDSGRNRVGFSIRKTGEGETVQTLAKCIRTFPTADMYSVQSCHTSIAHSLRPGDVLYLENEYDTQAAVQGTPSNVHTLPEMTFWGLVKL